MGTYMEGDKKMNIIHKYNGVSIGGGDGSLVGGEEDVSLGIVKAVGEEG